MKFLILIASVTFSFNALASSFNCGSFDSKLDYSTGQSDGGAARRGTVNLTYDGKDLINVPPSGSEILRLARVNMIGEALWSSEPVTTNFYRVTDSVYNMSVVSIADNSEIFTGPVHCRESRYVGPPRP